MKSRDFGALLLALLACYAALLQEGGFTFRKAWFVPLDDAEGPEGDNGWMAQGGLAEAEGPRLPRPVVGDLNGDGTGEVLVATPDYKIKVLQPAQAGRAGDGFAPAAVLAEASLLPAHSKATFGRRPVALATGHLEEQEHDFVHARRKQVIVVVTESWAVLCFDHNVKLLWEAHLDDHFPGHAELHEVAVAITPHNVREKDRGLVVVGGSVQLGKIGLRNGAVEEDLDRELADADAAARHAERLGEGGALEEDGAATSDGRGTDTSRHFSYHAFNGGDGQRRWKHQGADYHRDEREVSEALIPQHNYKLDAAALAGRHVGEVSCRDYREAVLRQLPHKWTSVHDTRLDVVHFEKHARQAHAAPLRGPGAAGGDPGGRDPRLHHGVDPDNRAAQALQRAAGWARAPVPAAGGEGGGAARRARRHERRGPKNALVAHLEEGIEIVHLFTGRTICKLLLPAPGLHADLNADGVIDHVQAFGGNPHSDSHFAAHHGQEVPGCWAVATSGLPVREQVFNASICRYVGEGGRSASGRTFGVRDGAFSLEVAQPALLPVPQTERQKAAQRRHARRKSDVLFMNSRGEVTSVDRRGARQWSVQAGTGWTSFVGELEARKVAPTLEAFEIRRGTHGEAVLAAGAYSAAVLSRTGRALGTLELPAPPVQPMLVVDWSGDGYNDLVLVTADTVYGYQQIHHAGGMPYAALVGVLVVVMSVIYFSHHGYGARVKRARGTELD